MTTNLKTRLAVASLGLALLACSATLLPAGEKKPDDKKKAPNYYPVAEGAAWHFHVTVNGNEAKATNRIAKIEKIDGVDLGRLEAVVSDKVVATEHVSQNDKGVFRHRYNGQVIDPPLPLIRYPVKAGDKWDGELKVGKDAARYDCVATEEEVSVPAGKFKAVKVVINVTENGNTLATTYWFVNDIGFVRQTVEAGNLNILMELEKRETKKDDKK
jgi:hypothetical protein